MVIILKNTEVDFEDVTPQEILDLACELEDVKEDLNSTNSAVNRTVYSKIYYAVFLFLRQWLEKNSGYKSLKGEHTKLPNYIKKNGPFSHKKNKEISRELLHLKKLSHQADYRLTVPSKDSKNYKRWKFTSIDSAFKIAKNIIKAFNGP